MASQSDDNAELERAMGPSPAQPSPSLVQPNKGAPGPALSDDQELERALSQPAASAGTSTGLPAANYANMPWSQVAKTGLSNLAPSAWNSIKSVPQTVMHPVDTANALGSAVKGGASEAGLINHDPKSEATWDALTAPYRSVAGFKKALAEDPFTVLTTASLPFSGGAWGLGKLGEVAGEATLAGKTLNTASGLSNAAATASNPLSLAGATIGGAGRLAGKTITGAQQFATGAPQTAFQTAVAAGKASAAGDRDLANAFNTFAKGQGDPVDLSRKVSNAIKGMKSDEINTWKQTKGNLANPQVDLSPVWQSIQDARANLSPRNVATDTALAAHDALDTIEGKVWDRVLSGDPENTSLMGIDKLKQELHDQYSGMHATPMASNALKSVHAGVRQALSDTSPEYDALMEKYQRMDDDIQNVTKSMGASNKTAANTELARQVRGLRTPDGQRLITRLGERDPTIPYMLAGAALHNTIAGGGSGLIEKASGAGHALNIGRALLGGDPADIIASVSYPFIQGTVQSPRIMGNLNYGAGWAGQKMAAPAQAFGIATGPVPTAAATNLSHSERNLSGNDVVPAFAAGGSVKKPNHEQLLARFVSMVEKAKKTEKERTKPLLNVPDDVIASALAAAHSTL